MPRLLELFAPRGESWGAGGLAAFRSLLLLHALVRTLAWMPAEFPGGDAKVVLVVAMRMLLLAVAVAGVWPRLGRPVATLAAALVLAQVVLSFPDVDDYIYLELAGLALCALFDERVAEDGRLLRSALCWMGALVLFHSGLQKLLHGYYFLAEFPLVAIATGDPVGQLYAWLVPAAEEARLRGINMFIPESGPFRIQSVPLILLSNAVWALEIELAVMVLARRTRRFAAVLAIAAVVVLQMTAHMPMAALLLSQFLLLCVPGEWNRRLAVVFVAAYAAVALAQAGVLPDALLMREPPR
jgi:hypothetical protein